MFSFPSCSLRLLLEMSENTKKGGPEEIVLNESTLFSWKQESSSEEKSNSEVSQEESALMNWRNNLIKTVTVCLNAHECHYAARLIWASWECCR